MMSSKITDALDNAAGKAQKAQGESLSTFLASLTTSGIILALGTVVNIFLKCRFPEYYSQQARRISDWEPPSLSPWILFLPMPNANLKHVAGLDNYFFDRYLHTLTRIFLLLGLTIPPILIPLNVIDGKNEAGGVRGLDRLTFSNVGLSHASRYWTHLVVAIIVVTSICYILRLELRAYKTVLSRLSTSELGVSKSSLLLVSKSKQQLSREAIRRHLNNIGGGVHTISINRDYNSLHAKLRRRDVLVARLETAETNLIVRANKRRTLHRRAENEKHGKDGCSMALWTKYLDQKDRLLTRLPAFPWLPSLPFIGPQVDMIYHLRSEVARYNREIEWDQLDPNKFPRTNSAFIYFNQRVSTQLATLALKTRIPPSWTLKYGTTPGDTIWQNVPISWWQQCIRTIIVYLLAAALTLGFAFPVAIIGSLSQIEYLDNVIPWLRWIGSLPSWLVAVIQGALPPAMLALVTATVPVVLRLLANIQGLHSRQATENQVQIYFFAFLFIQGFLAISLSAGITTIIGELTDTIEAVPAVLARNLPKACNYFFSYILIHTFTAIVYTPLQIGGLVSLFVLSPMLDKTARQKWLRGERLSLQKWGTFIPVFTNIACIGFIYSVIAPLILAFSTICFSVFWILFRIYPPKLTEVDLVTYGVFYPTAVRQLFTGIYFMELCLAGLFFLVRDADGKAACIAQAVIMLLVTVLTGFFHYAIDDSHWMPWLCRRETNELSTPKRGIARKDIAQDQALSSPRPVIWIPKDELGIADDEILNLRRTYDSLWMSNEGASLDRRGKLNLLGSPPEFPKQIIQV